MNHDYKKLESFPNSHTVRLMLPSKQIKKLHWKGGDYVKVYCEDNKMIIEAIKD